jgi:hypothetical protein
MIEWEQIHTVERTLKVCAVVQAAATLLAQSRIGEEGVALTIEGAVAEAEALWKEAVH